MVDKWTNPTTANLRGENSLPLQQTFSSLSSYLGKLDDAITAAAASGVSSIAAGSGISVSAGTGAVTVANTGVTSVAGTGDQISVSASTGGVTLSLPSTVSFPGRVNITAQNLWFGAQVRQMINLWSSNDATPQYGIGVQSGTQYFRTGSNFAWYSGGTHNDAELNSGGGTRYAYLNATGLVVEGTLRINKNSSGFYQNSTSSWSGNPGGGQGKIEYHSNRWYIASGSDSAEILRIRRDGTDEVSIDNDGTVRAYAYCGNENVGGTGSAAWFPNGLYSGINGQVWLYGPKHFGYGHIDGSGYHWGNGTSLTYANSISCSGWFRAVGQSGLYFESYGGGFWMTDGTWIRSYGEKNVYFDREFRVNGVISSNTNRARGSYGAISTGANGITNTWDGIEFASAQTFMIQGDQYSGVYRNNNTWNWLFSYSSLIIGSDERYKREIQPLNIGLNFIELLEPISYLKLTETPDDDPETTEPDYYYGFSAQNVRAALDAVGETRDVKIHNVGGPNMGLVACTDDAVYDRQYIGINEFIAPMVQAIKELSARVAELEKSTV